MDKKIILLVDDNKDYWQVIKDYFFNFSVLTCGTVKDAIEVLEHTTPRYILLDVVLNNDFGVSLLMYLAIKKYTGKILMISSVANDAMLDSILKIAKKYMDISFFDKMEYSKVRRIIIEDFEKNT